MWKSSLLGLLLGLTSGQERLPFEGRTSVFAIPASADVNAILSSWRITGVMACVSDGKPRVCLRIENAFPCGVFEVVHQPFRTHLAEVEPLMKTMKALPFKLTSSAGSDRGQTSLQFAEARVYTHVPALVSRLEIPLAVPRAAGFTPSYVSELDAIAWRTGWPDLLLRPTTPATCAGCWGSYYPRTGFVIDGSEPRAAHLQALRAGRAASDPAGRVVLSPYPYEPRTGHFLQMLKPVPKPAVKIGARGPIDEGAGSLHGAFLFIHLGIFEECHRCLPTRLAGAR